MKIKFETNTLHALDELCLHIKTLVAENKYDECIPMICRAMVDYPHAPHPHNLLGIILEKTGDHLTAMKHFRAAWALDPTYAPANHNLHTFGTFFSRGACAFDESDVTGSTPSDVVIAYDERGIAHVVNKKKAQYDENGICRLKRR